MAKKTFNSWNWYGVKLIFEFQITGEPEKEKIDKKYTNQFTVYEEKIILVKAQSFDHALKIAEKKAIEREEEYVNPYGENVKYKFAGVMFCNNLGGIDEFSSGDEVYSHYIPVTKGTGINEFLDRCYPDTTEKSCDIYGIYYLHVLTYREPNTPGKRGWLPGKANKYCK